MILRKNTMLKIKYFDTVIVGSGPSGIFTAIRLASAGLSVAIVDKGGNYESRAISSEKGLIGFGGAAMSYDANLDYSEGIPEQSSLGERVFGSRQVAVDYIAQVYTILEQYGLDKKNTQKSANSRPFSPDLEVIDRGVLPIGEKVSTKILKSVYKHLMHVGVEFLEFSEATALSKDKDFFQLKVCQQEREINLNAKNVVFATGKLSLFATRKILDDFGISYTKCSSIDIGIRVETKRISTDSITEGCVNPKIILEEDGASTRTFCWCPGGKVISYDFEGLNIIDGQHCHDNPTDQTNFGIVTTINLPEGVDGTNLGLKYIQAFNELTKGRTGIQIMDDFENGRVSSISNIENNIVKPTITSYESTDLGAISIFNSKQKILNLIKKINDIYPNSIDSKSFVYGPVLEKIFPRIKLSSNMESSHEGVFFVGDISGKAIGVITGSAMGLRAADYIISKLHEN
jgi:uncharacterized FAD-dependent dehydrogenase